MLPVRVPCLSQDPYENKAGAFEDYPHQRDWNINLLRRRIFNQHPSEDTGAFLQDWLFFGTLYEVLGDDGIKENCSRWDEQSNHALVTTKTLISFLRTRFWQIRDNFALSPDGKTRAIADIDRMILSLFLVSYLCNKSTAGEKVNTTLTQPRWPLSLEIDLSIRALGQLLATRLFSTRLFLTESVVTDLTFPNGHFTSSWMREAGWCPSDIAMASKYMSASSLYYASSLRCSQLRSDHSNCDRQLCPANQIESTTYETAH